MKLSFWDRVLIVLFAILGIAFTACLGLRVYGYDIMGDFVTRLNVATPYGDYIALAIALLIALTGVLVIVFMFRRDGRGRDRAFVVIDSSDKGRVRIAMSAIEQMVRQAVGPTEGSGDLKINVHNEEDAISISVDMSVAAGVHVPTVTLNMQRDIREYVEMNCGIAVRGVSVTIHSVTADQNIGTHAGYWMAKHHQEPVAQEPAREDSASTENFAAQETAPAAQKEEMPLEQDLSMPAEAGATNKEAHREEEA